MNIKREFTRLALAAVMIGLDFNSDLSVFSQKELDIYL
jgi:hypothetical protein